MRNQNFSRWCRCGREKHPSLPVCKVCWTGTHELTEGGAVSPDRAKGKKGLVVAYTIGGTLTCEIRGCSDTAVGSVETMEQPPRPVVVDLCRKHYDSLLSYDRWVLEWEGSELIIVDMLTGELL